MHVEIRLCEVEHACAFDPQSFYRVKQLLSSYSGQSNAAEEPARRTWHGGSLLRLQHTAPFTPELKLQVVVERLTEMESKCFGATMDKKQHEARVKSHWNNSAVGTAYYSAEVKEVVLASLPPAAAHSVVKIRLLQLPPQLDYNAQQVVKRAIGDMAVSRDRHDTPLCIGIAKICLRELMLARKTVRIAMQAKRAVVSAVEAHNLDTLITNAMFGRGERNGSAVLSVQFNGYTFGRVPRGGPIPNHSPVGATKRITTAMDSNEPSTALPLVSNGAAGESAAEMESEALNSRAIHFVLLPYVALVDVLLRMVDVASWRVPRKTGMALTAIAIALYADLFDMLFVLTLALVLLSVLRNISLFYYVPVSDHTASRVTAPSVVGSGTTNFQPFLYSRENALLNSLLRARVFFSRGLMDDTYYELALAAHLARHNRRQLAGLGLAVCCGFAFLSMGAVVSFLTLGAFTAYPVFLNLSNARRRTRRKKVSLLVLIRYAVDAIHVPRRYPVVRVIRVAVVRARTEKSPSRNESIVDPVAETLQQQFLNCIRQRAESVEARSPTEKSELSMKTRESNIPAVYRQVRTMDLDVLPNNSANFASTLNRFQVTHVMRYFVALCFSSSVIESAELASTTSGLRKPPSNAALQRRLCDQLRQARIISGMLPSVLPQSNNIATGGGVTTFTQHSGSVTGDSKPAVVSKEMQEAFQNYFNSTLTLLFYLRQQWTFHPYVTQSSTTKCMPDSMRSVSVLAQPQDLIDAGEDDGVTKALMARRQAPHNSPLVGRFSSGNPVEVSGRIMALYAAYLLQGARLSVYMSSNGCATFLPLLAPGNCMERFLQPNPCPADLLNTLDSVWRGETHDTMKKGKEVYFNADAVLQIITVYKNYWEGGANFTSTRSAVRLDSTVAGESYFSNALHRSSARSALVSLPPIPRQQIMPYSASTHLTRSLQDSTTPQTKFGTAAAGSAELLPARFFSSAATELNMENVVSQASAASSDLYPFSNGALSDPPVLDATYSRDARGQLLVKDERARNSVPDGNGARTASGKGNAAETLFKSKR
ncbi:hypothetical protein LPMP_200310 [Leishmania panamensis]|uniref:Uncharacterized protein n=1 Tax=Leishmania panamensis TaxID=5679 RepID=A0A088RNK4_LEIPA|nr:hypothetical protein LPMP_200310 [Leishmania panamensis]AIN97523.1 hypothetical protein LPMP_200310 [Leishmania panamensis]